MIEVTWVETTAEVYWKIREAHADLQVFGTISRDQNSSLGDRRFLTDWGLPGADVPLLRYDDRGEEPGREIKYYLARVETEAQP